MTILYVFIAVIVGWFIGFLDSNLRTAKKIEAAESGAELMMQEAERKIARAAQNSSTQQDDPGLLRLKKNEGRFMLELDGTPITGEISSDQRKRLIELITVFRLWLEGPVAAPPAPDPVREIAPRPVPPSPPKPLAPVKKPEAEKVIASTSIVQQIDTILQTNMTDTPLAKRGIRLQESIQGGVEVYVGLQKFLAVEDVPDEAIKAAIRAAIAEWEKKFTPGL